MKSIFRHKRLREIMKKQNISCKDIAKYLTDIYGEPNYRYAEWIVNGEKEPDIDDVAAICKAVNCTSDYLLGLSDETN